MQLIQQMNLARMEADIVETAKLVSAPYEAQTIRRTLEQFEWGFRNEPVEFRTSTKPVQQRGVSYRFVDYRSGRDPFRHAVEVGALVPRGRPVDLLVPELTSKFPVIGFGVDADAKVGLEKIWPFLDHMLPIEVAMEIRSLPPAVRGVREYLHRHGLHHFNIVAADYHHETANLYFAMRNPFMYDADRIGRMIGELGFAVPDRQALEYNANAVFANMTFSWRSDTPERLCFYVPAPAPDLVPVGANPLLAELVEKAPMLEGPRAFIVGYTFGRQGSYIKLETDYSTRIMGALATATLVEALEPGDVELAFLTDTAASPLAAPVRAFDPESREFLDTAAEGASPTPRVEGTLTSAPFLLSDAARDFGGIRRRAPAAVLRPRTVEDVQEIVRFAAEHSLPVAMRGQGHSAFGQAQAPEGIVIDSRSLKNVHEITDESVTVDAGATLRRVCARTLPESVPLVLTDYLDLSVGGVLSVGGIGGTTQHFGAFADTALELDVVTGSGDLGSLLRKREPDALRVGSRGLGTVRHHRPRPSRARHSPACRARLPARLSRARRVPRGSANGRARRSLRVPGGAHCASGARRLGLHAGSGALCDVAGADGRLEGSRRAAGGG